MDSGVIYIKKTYPTSISRLIFVHKTYILEIDKYSDSQPRDDHGRWTNGGGSDGGGSGSSAGGSHPETAKPPRMSRKEKDRVSHGIATDFPKLEADGVKRLYDYGNYSYEFYVNGFGSYRFTSKKRLR